MLWLVINAGAASGKPLLSESSEHINSAPNRLLAAHVTYDMSPAPSECGVLDCRPDTCIVTFTKEVNGGGGIPNRCMSVCRLASARES